MSRLEWINVLDKAALINSKLPLKHRQSYIRKLEQLLFLVKLLYITRHPDDQLVEWFVRSWNQTYPQMRLSGYVKGLYGKQR